MLNSYRNLDIQRVSQLLVPSLLLILTLVSTAGCAAYKTAPIAASLPDQIYRTDDSDRLQESLFKGDQALLSNQDVERILTSKVTLADRHRIAVLYLNSRYSSFQEIAAMETQNSEQFLKSIAAHPQFTQVRFMPGLLIPEKRTVPYLREAAARFQADLLLIYGTRLRTFQRDRLLGVDEVRADAIAESVLLDVRTGIVIHTANSTEGMSARRNPSDLNFNQTVSKAQTEATGKALQKLAASITEFAATATK